MSEIDLNALMEIVAPLEGLLSDPSVWEVMIDRHDRVLVDRQTIEQVESPFESVEQYEQMILDLFGLFGVAVGRDNPVADIRLPDYSRVLTVWPPVATGGEPYLVLRRIAGRQMTWERLLEYGSLSVEMKGLLDRAVADRQNLLVVGGTGSGKTTLARLLVQMFPAAERVIVVEPIYELDAKHPRMIHLEAGKALSMQDVLLTAAKMRPDRLVVGQLTGGEALHALELFRNGYDGSLTALHGTSVEDGLARLEVMCLMANVGLGLAEIRQVIAGSVQMVVSLQRGADGKRRVLQISALRGVEGMRYVLQPLARYDEARGVFEVV